MNKFDLTIFNYEALELENENNKLKIFDLQSEIDQIKEEKLQAIQDEEAKIVQIIDLVNASIYWKDVNGTILGCNRYMLDIFGIKERKDVVGKSVDDLLPKGEADKINEIDKLVMEKGSYDGEEYATIITGEQRVYFTSKRKIVDNHGNILIAGTSLDITAQKKIAELEKQQLILNEEDKILQIIDLVNASIYWRDVAGKMLGCNKYVLDMFGVKERKDIIGKDEYDLLPKDEADKINVIDDIVLQQGYYQGEEYATLANGEKRVFLTTKTRLYDNQYKIIGTVGTSLDITAQKEAENLKLEKKAQDASVEAQKKFRKSVGQMIHDIRGPLSSLQMIVSSTSEIPEDKRIDLRETANAISDITHQLLQQYEPKENASDKPREKQTTLVSTIIANAASDRRQKLNNLQIEFKYEVTPLNAFYCIKTVPSDLRRAISNLINNAVEAMPKKGGKLEVKLTANDANVMINILDNGKGIPDEVLQKIKQNEMVTHGKEDGHGLGMTQVFDTVKNSHGAFDIFSSTDKRNNGTTVMLSFPRIADPDWLASEVNLTKDDIILILDDDKSVHNGWEAKFKHILEKIPTIKVEHYYKAEDAIEFVNDLSADDRNKICFLSDYELIGQNTNGLEVINKLKIKRSMLVTSWYIDAEIRKAALQIGVKILPKDLVHLVPVNIVQAKKPGAMISVHIVFVDDDKNFSRRLIAQHYSHLVTAQYSNPFEFFEESDLYPKDTQIVLDNYYYTEDGATYNIDGLTLAGKLHAKGFTNLTLLSGESFPVPDYLTIVLKTDQKAIAQLYKGS